MKSTDITAENILKNVERYIAEIDNQPHRGDYSCRQRRYKIWDICDELSIFDWWKEYLSKSQLKDMQKFLKTAISLGYTGYVCFKVGAKHCANGMWAYKNISENGYAPNGEALYKSFTSEYNYWDACDATDCWNLAHKYGVPYDGLRTVHELRRAMKKVYGVV